MQEQHNINNKLITFEYGYQQMYRINLEKRW